MYTSLQSIYTNTLATNTFHIIMVIMVYYDLEYKPLDITNALLNASLQELSELILCELPEGYMDWDLIVKLDKVLYRLKELPLLLFKEFS
jgi:hypothetical protein